MNDPVVAMGFQGASPGFLLRAEGLALLVASCWLYAALFPGKWAFFALLFLGPDVSLLGFLSKAKVFATALYNCLHTEALPILLGLVGWRMGWTTATEVSLIWLAHISFDRVLGFGLKYPGSFKATHLQRTA